MYLLFVICFFRVFSLSHCLTRADVDYNTPIGNCSFEKPVYGTRYGEDISDCYDKGDLIPNERSTFLDINRSTWVHVNFHITGVYTFHNQWEKNAIKFRHHHWRILFVPPHYGQLLYIQGSYQHIFIRTYGPTTRPTEPTTQYTSTSIIPPTSTSAPTSSPTR